MLARVTCRVFPAMSNYIAELLMQCNCAKLNITLQSFTFKFWLFRNLFQNLLKYQTYEKRMHMHRIFTVHSSDIN